MYIDGVDAYPTKRRGKMRVAAGIGCSKGLTAWEKPQNISRKAVREADSVTTAVNNPT